MAQHWIEPTTPWALAKCKKASIPTELLWLIYIELSAHTEGFLIVSVDPVVIINDTITIATQAYLTICYNCNGDN
jgi:hypothetical protein